MTRESLDKVRALVEKRQHELKESDNPKVFARQKLIDGGLFLENGEPNPIFDSHKHDVIAFEFTDLKLQGKPAVAISQPSGGGYIFASIGEKLEKAEIISGSEHVFSKKNIKQKLTAIERLKIAHKNK
jgi:hypothetical protein